MSIESVIPFNHLILCRPLLFLPSIFPNIRGFSNESVLHIRWPKYWSISFSISPSNEYSGLISFRMDWLDLHAVQGTLKSLLQHHSTKVSIPQHSAFFMVLNKLSLADYSQDKTPNPTQSQHGLIFSSPCSPLCSFLEINYKLYIRSYNKVKMVFSVLLW